MALRASDSISNSLRENKLVTKTEILDALLTDTVHSTHNGLPHSLSPKRAWGPPILHVVAVAVAVVVVVFAFLA